MCESERVYAMVGKFQSSYFARIRSIVIEPDKQIIIYKLP